jgi:hypothetical protein
MPRRHEEMESPVRFAIAAWVSSRLFLRAFRFVAIRIDSSKGAWNRSYELVNEVLRFFLRALALSRDTDRLPHSIEGPSRRECSLPGRQGSCFPLVVSIPKNSTAWMSWSIAGRSSTGTKKEGSPNHRGFGDPSNAVSTKASRITQANGLPPPQEVPQSATP